jgi:tetratricopeptide (TPR) repeat protein
VTAALAHALVAQLAIVAHAPATVAACEPVEVSVAVSASGTVAPRVLMPPLTPFELLRTTSRPNVSQAAGSPTIMVEHKYVVTTDRVGSFTVPPFEAHLGGAIVRSRPLRIEVQAGRAEGTVPTVVTRAQIDTSLEVNFRALAMPETVYVGQQANYEVAVFLSETVRDRLRRNPTFFPPDMQSMLAYDLPVVKGDPPRRRVGRRCFDALVYQRAVFPLLAGRFVVPPAQLVYALSLTPSFFSREESHELRTDSAVIVAIDPPTAFRPADFTGAVGALQVAARLDTAVSRVGDPLLLSVRVEGTGNVKLFPRPSVSVPWGTLVAGEERVRVDTTARRIRGSKEFDWILTPHRDGELEVPAVRYTFFNPDGRRYETAVASPLRVSITPASAAAADTAAAERALAIRTAYRGPLGRPLYTRSEYWLLLAAAPLPALLFGARTRSRARTLPTNRRRELRAVAADRAVDARGLRRAFTTALGDRLGVSPETFSRAGALDRVLRHAGVPAALAAETEQFLRKLDASAYAADGSLSTGAGKRAVELYNRVDAEALRPWEIRGGVVLLLVAALSVGLTGALAAARPEEAAELFGAGVRAYESRDYDRAQRAFGALARQEPRAPDAWANFGTASWAARDTARAVAGWQRALRLEPLAGDVRSRLGDLRAETLTSAGFVPPVTPGALAIALAACWWGAWIACAGRIRRRSASRRPVLMFALATVAVALASVHQVERLSGRDLVVIQTAGALAVSPALGADRAGSTELGEVARVRALHGVWSRVVLDGGRSGWMESSRLISLGAPPID